MVSPPRHQGPTPPLWQDFLAGPLYPAPEIPWQDDPAFAIVNQFPGLRESIGGRLAEALVQTIGLVQALTQLDLPELVRRSSPAQGLCLGFGMNAMEPYDLLCTFALDQVHGYEWIGEHVLEAAQLLTALAQREPTLPARVRLHHGTISDLSALPDRSIRVVYVGNVFTHEIPLAPETLTRIVRETLRVLDDGGVVISRGSSGVFEDALAPAGRLLVQIPLVSVFQKQDGEGRT
jgi:hypothetical protein